jgi:antitoxin ParD1/3/4
MCHAPSMAQLDNAREPVGVNVSLTPELARFVESKVEAGAYASASEVVLEGLWLLVEQGSLRQARRHHLRDMVRTGLDQARRGALVDAGAAFQEVEQELDEQERKHGRT